MILGEIFIGSGIARIASDPNFMGQVSAAIIAGLFALLLAWLKRRWRL